jgi:hypothetical protein
MYVERRKAVTVNFDEIARHYGEMTEKGIIMSFKGALAQPIIVEIGQTLRSKIAARPAESTSARARLIKTIFSIFIELAQNVMHYSAEKEEDENGKEYGVGLLVISQNAGVYAVSSANQIPVDAAERVRDKCESIAAMTREKLKERYNEQRRLPHNAGESKGAGLGLLDVARRSDFRLNTRLYRSPKRARFLWSRQKCAPKIPQRQSLTTNNLFIHDQSFHFVLTRYGNQNRNQRN